MCQHGVRLLCEAFQYKARLIVYHLHPFQAPYIRKIELNARPKSIDIGKEYQLILGYDAGKTTFVLLSLISLSVLFVSVSDTYCLFPTDAVMEDEVYDDVSEYDD